MDAHSLYTEIKDWVTSVARSFSLIGVLTPEDLTQEAFIVCYEVSLKYSMTDDDSLMRIAKRSIRNKFVNFYRYYSYRFRVQDDLDLNQIPGGYEQPFQVFVAKECTEYIRDHLNKLEKVVFDCLISVPEGVMIRAQIEFNQKQGRSGLVMNRDIVKINDRHIASYLKVSSATISRSRTRIKDLFKTWEIYHE